MVFTDFSALICLANLQQDNGPYLRGLVLWEWILFLSSSSFSPIHVCTYYILIRFVLLMAISLEALWLVVRQRFPHLIPIMTPPQLRKRARARVKDGFISFSLFKLIHFRFLSISNTYKYFIIVI